MMSMNNFDAKHPMEQDLRHINIHDLLPQQEPFVMIGALVYFDRTLTVAETEIKSDNIFVESILKKGIQLGFIGAVRNFELFALPQVGDVITTRVEVKEEVFGMTLAEATVTLNGKLLASTEMKIAVKNTDELQR